MSIEYRELTTENDFSQCIALQKEIFGFSDIDCISPLILKLISRKKPEIGLTLAAFENEKNEMLGFITGIPTPIGSKNDNDYLFTICKQIDNGLKLLS